VLLVVCNPKLGLAAESTSEKYSLVKVLNNTFQNAEVISREYLNYSPYSFYPGIEVLDLCRRGGGRNVSHPVIGAIGIALVWVALVIW
jgi:hypothetical protein